MGVIIAYKMLQYGIEKREVAIVGRLTKFSCASFVSYQSSYSVRHINDVIARHELTLFQLACTLVGRTSCCIDSKSGWFLLQLLALSFQANNLIETVKSSKNEWFRYHPFWMRFA